MIINEASNLTNPNQVVELKVVDPEAFTQWISESKSNKLNEVYLMKNDPRVSACKSHLVNTGQATQRTQQSQPLSSVPSIVTLPWGLIGALGTDILAKLGLERRK